MEDFKAIEKSSTVVEMEPGDFREIASGVSFQKLKLLADDDDRPYLASCKVIQVRRGQDLVYTKTSHAADTWLAFDVTKKTFVAKDQPEARKRPRGVNRAKLETLKKQLLPLLPIQRRPFWETLTGSTARELNG